MSKKICGREHSFQYTNARSENTINNINIGGKAYKPDHEVVPSPKSVLRPGQL
jgi:hypothetical protein